MKIYICDPWKKHWWEGVDYWRKQGHDVGIGPYWGPSIMEGRDVVIFHAIQDNLKKASHTEKPKDTVIIAEAVDIDIYSGHLGAVDWSYVDSLVYMAKHMQTISSKKNGAKIADVPQTIIPGGIDLDKWTLREGEIGHNIAWIGRLWVPKDVFGALMVFNELLHDSPRGVPWRLFILHDNKWHPEWYKNHVLAYLEDNPFLNERIEWVRHVPDVNVWLDEMKIDYLLQTSQKEAFGYVIAQAAAKGIKPIIRNTNGALDLWPAGWVFDTHDEAVGMFIPYDRDSIRFRVAASYPLSRRMEAFDALIAQYA